MWQAVTCSVVLLSSSCAGVSTFVWKRACCSPFACNVHVCAHCLLALTFSNLCVKHCP